jgi:hypothetical protein
VSGAGCCWNSADQLRGIEHEGNAPEGRCDFLEQAKPFAADREFVGAEAGDVTNGSGKACDKALLDRVGYLNKHDGHCAGRLCNRRQVCCGSDEDHVRHLTNQLGRVDARERGISGVPADIDVDVLAFGPSRLA